MESKTSLSGSTSPSRTLPQHSSSPDRDTYKLKPILSEDDKDDSGGSPRKGDGEEKSTIFGGLRRAVVMCVLWSLAVFIASGYSLIGCIFPIEADEKGSSGFTTGLIIGASPLCLMFAAPLTGHYLPRMGMKLTITSSTLLVGGSFFLFGFLVDLPSGAVFVVVAIALRMIEGVGWGMCITAIFAMIPQLFPSRVGTFTGVIVGGIGLGYTIGPLIGSVLVIGGGYRTPFLIVGGIILLFTPVIFLLVKSTESCSPKILSLRTIFKLLSHLSFSMIVLGSLVSFASLTVLRVGLSVYLMNEIHLNLVHIGMLFSVLSLMFTLFSYLSGPLADKIGPRRLIIAGLFSGSTALIVLGFSPSIPLPQEWIVLFSMIVLGCGQSLVGVSAYSDFLEQAHRHNLKEDKYTLNCAISGITTFSRASGAFMGAILGGFLIDMTDFPTTSMMTGEATLAQAFIVLGVTLINSICEWCRTEKDERMGA